MQEFGHLVANMNTGNRLLVEAGAGSSNTLQL